MKYVKEMPYETYRRNTTLNFEDFISGLRNVDA